MTSVVAASSASPLYFVAIASPVSAPRRAASIAVAEWTSMKYRVR
jgi:hypothetical protein